MAYDCLVYANDATDVLKSELGAACKEFKTEDQYLAAILNQCYRNRRRPRGLSGLVEPTGPDGYQNLQKENPST